MSKLSNKEAIEQIFDKMGSASSLEVDLNSDEFKFLALKIPNAQFRIELSTQHHISVSRVAGGGGTKFQLDRIASKASGAAPTPAAPPQLPSKPRPRSEKSAGLIPNKMQHTYQAPECLSDIMSALLDEVSHVLWFVGPTQCGKSLAARYAASELGMVLHQINCHDDMSAESFFGEKTIEVDPESGQNHIVFQDGILVRAMQEGLDEDGNEVGAPGLLFVDEAGAIPPKVAIALNRMLESDDARRTVTLEHDGGRIVRSHSRFRIIFAANTAGRGITDMNQALYTAQADALDISLLQRVSMTFRFGYDRKVERKILMEKTGNDRVAQDILKFRDAIRDHIRSGKLSTPFSTGTLVHIANAYKLFRDIPKAIYYTVYEHLMPEEVAVYNETAKVGLGIDISAKFTSADIDYM